MSWFRKKKIKDKETNFLPDIGLFTLEEYHRPDTRRVRDIYAKLANIFYELTVEEWNFIKVNEYKYYEWIVNRYLDNKKEVDRLTKKFILDHRKI